METPVESETSPPDDQEYIEIEAYPDVEILNPCDPPPLPIVVPKAEPEDVVTPRRPSKLPVRSPPAFPSPAEMGAALARPFESLRTMTRRQAKDNKVLLPGTSAPPDIPLEHTGRQMNRAKKALGGTMPKRR